MSAAVLERAPDTGPGDFLKPGSGRRKLSEAARLAGPASSAAWAAILRWPRTAQRIIRQSGHARFRRRGYLLKDRVFTDEQFTDASRTVARGGTVMDPEVAAQLLAKRSRQLPGTSLADREREVLALMAEGRSNSAIAQRLFVSERR